jgi:uncharacterized RDD family membrane protein YckC
MIGQGKTKALTVKTPEGIVFSLLLSGPVTRFLAWAIDMVCIFVVASGVRMVLGVLGVISRDLAFGASILAYFLISIGYGIGLEWYWHGQTLGKRLLRLRVMDEQVLRLQFSQIAIRNLLRFVDSIPIFYVVGGLACLISRRAQRLGDFAANTVVVWNPGFSEPNVNQLLAGKYNSFRDYPHLEARLRHLVSPQEAGLALQALLRRDGLDPQPRIELFREITSHFRSIVAFPQEATEGLSDEQYVRNAVDVLFRSRTRGESPFDAP